MTASDDVSEVTIQPHNELAYAAHYPTKVIFFCETPSRPGCGGESAITRNKDVKENLAKDVKEKFKKLGIRYHRYLPCKEQESRYTSWQKVFWTDNKDDVVKYMDKFNNPYSWDEKNALSYSYLRPAFIRHPTTGESIWFNHAHAHHSSRLREHPSFADMQDEPHGKFAYHVTYGDGSEVELETIQHIRDVLWQQTVGFQMQKGDVIFFDNLTTMHARLGFTGKRKLLASFAED
ncbi:dapdiamide synthesis protein DdaC-like [Ptychodera flava]|uniref:dapdiamide synthesis protein DdaC-like n=1 Tax=Ptychodera flava TaxID=63121 RepID=UPI003969F30A